MNNTIPKEWTDNHAQYLMDYAAKDISDSSQAEKLVNETFLLSLASGASFSSDAALRKWLTAILKNKIADHLSKNSTPNP